MGKTTSESISQLAPEGLTYICDKPQQLKSARMRIAILEATLECLTKHGYANTSNALICKTGNISRGAMLYHYPTRPDLLTDVTEYAFYKHMRAFSHAISELSEEDRKDHNKGIAVDWEVCQTKAFQAYLELRVAARTNKELSRIFLPRARHHDQVWKNELLKNFPEWRDDMQKLDLTRRFLRAFLEGLTMSRDLWKDPDTEWILLRFVADIAYMIRTDTLTFPDRDSIENFTDVDIAFDDIL